MHPTPSELAEIDAALRLIDRELWIITAADGDRRGGLVATWVSAASIDRDRPVLLVGIGPNHFTAELVQLSRAFAAHLLRPDQIELAWNFANGSGKNRDKLAGLGVENHGSGPPIMTDCLAWFNCRVFARYDAGDRLFFWANVVGGSRRGNEAVDALREHEFIQRLTAEQRQTLIADRTNDAALNGPNHEKWRLKNPW